MLFDSVGREVAAAHVPIDTPTGPDRVEHDAAGLLRSLRTAAHDVCAAPLARAASSPPDSRPSARRSVAGTAATAAPQPRDLVAGSRNAAWLEQQLGTRSGWVRELTGLPLSPHYGASKMRWCLDELPSVRLALRDGRLCLGPLASFLAQGLCAAAEACVDPANAARTPLFDPAVLDWSPPLLEAFGIPAAVLPRCVGTLHDFGRVAGRCNPECAAARVQRGPVRRGLRVRPTLDDHRLRQRWNGAFVQRVLRDGTGPAPRGLLKSVLFARTDDAAGASIATKARSTAPTPRSSGWASVSASTSGAR